MRIAGELALKIAKRLFETDSIRHVRGKENWQIQKSWIDMFGTPFLRCHGRKAQFSCDEDVHALVHLLRSTAGGEFRGAVEILHARTEYCKGWLCEICQDDCLVLDGCNRSQVLQQLVPFSRAYCGGDPYRFFGMVFWVLKSTWTVVVLPDALDVVVLCSVDDTESNLHLRE